MTTIQDRIIEKLYELTEQLADIEHQRWSDWQSYLHSKLTYYEYQKDDKNYACYILDAGDFEHWSRQIDTDYKSLTEKEKNSDREQVDRYMPIIKQFLLTSIKEVEEETRNEIIGKVEKEFLFLSKLDKEFSSNPMLIKSLGKIKSITNKESKNG